MPRILTLFLMLHWATVFSLLAAFSIADSSGAEGFRAFGLDLHLAMLDERHALMMRAAISFAFTICAVLFWWTFATLLLSLRRKPPKDDDILRVAFSAAALLMTLMLLSGAIGQVDHLLPIMATHIAALVASYVAVQAERENLTLPNPVNEAQLRLTARVKALDAAQLAALARFAPNPPILGRFDR